MSLEEGVGAVVLLVAGLGEGLREGRVPADAAGREDGLADSDFVQVVDDVAASGTGLLG